MKSLTLDTHGCLMASLKNCHITLFYCTAIHAQHKVLCIILIQSGHFYSASLSPLLLRGTPDTARILCRSFTPKRHRQLRVKGPKVPTWWLDRDSILRPFGRKASNLSMSHQAPWPY